MSISYQTILYSVTNRVATITFNRPDLLNAINQQLREETLHALNQAIADDEVRLIVITGSGRHFGAGQDLTSEDDFSAGVIELIEKQYRPVIMGIYNSPKPVISAINGACAGVSSAFAMACDLAVMADDAFIYMAFASIGLVPDGGACWFLARQLGAKRAFQLIAEGGRLPASECLKYGLVNKIVHGDKLKAEAQEWAETLSEGSPLAQKYAKQAVQAAFSSDLSTSISIEAGFQDICFKSMDFANAVEAFKEKKTPKFLGH